MKIYEQYLEIHWKSIDVLQLSSHTSTFQRVLGGDLRSLPRAAAQLPATAQPSWSLRKQPEAATSPLQLNGRSLDKMEYNNILYEMPETSTFPYPSKNL